MGGGGAAVLFVLLLAFAGVALIGSRVRLLGFTDDYLSIDRFTTIRGVFATLVLFSHMNQYVVPVTPLDALEAEVLRSIGQLMVAPFLFISGYGVALSYSVRKGGYVRDFPRHRILKVWFHFAVAVLAFIVLGRFLGREWGLARMVLAFTGWTSISNSNWYMFDTLLLYCLSYVVMVALERVGLATERRLAAGVALSFLTGMAAVLVLSRLQPTRFYNTLLCYPAGGLFYVARGWIGQKVLSDRCPYLLTLALLLGVFLLTYCDRLQSHRVSYNLCAASFVVLLLLVSCSLSLANPVLTWLGQHSFYTYIYMRIPMEVLKSLGMGQNVALFSVLSIALTVALAWVARLVQERLDEAVLGQ